MNWNALLTACTYSATRSGGPGGQHANKVATQVEIRFDLGGTEWFSPPQKAWAMERLSHRLTKEGVLILSCSDSRSQVKNKELVQKRLVRLLKSAIRPPKIRKKRSTPRWVKEKRLQSKRQRSEKKQNRKPPSW
ncbi:MAG: alternative ribosome rescue aminoacyl-tRNA hydrolase ArfB [Bacteroidota bacterium]